jgi:glutamyl-tRNA reductase
MDSVYLYNVDDLSRVAEQNKALRDEAMHEAELVIEYGLNQFDRWRHKVSIQPELVDFRARIRAVCEAEAQAVLGSAADPTAIQELAHRIGQKIAHDVTQLMVSDEE